MAGIHTAPSRELSIGGALWQLKAQAGLFAGTTYDADTHSQRATLGRFGTHDRRVRFTLHRLVLETDAGQVIASCNSLRTSFAGHVNHTPWDQLLGMPDARGFPNQTVHPLGMNVVSDRD